jgi:hypothetical protein
MSKLVYFTDEINQHRPRRDALSVRLMPAIVLMSVFLRFAACVTQLMKESPYRSVEHQWLRPLFLRQANEKARLRAVLLFFAVRGC